MLFTEKDSLVFGGNFLHSFAIEKQLQVAHIEELTRVPTKFRLPFFTELLWYVLDRYSHCVLGKTHLDLPDEEKKRIKLEKGENIDPNQEIFRIGDGGVNVVVTPVHLTPTELQGIKFIVYYLHTLPPNKKHVPIMLPDPISVIKNIRELVIEHRDDNPEKAITGKYILRWTEDEEQTPTKKQKRNSLNREDSGSGAKAVKKSGNEPKTPKKAATNSNNANN